MNQINKKSPLDEEVEKKVKSIGQADQDTQQADIVQRLLRDYKITPK